MSESRTRKRLLKFVAGNPRLCSGYISDEGLVDFDATRAVDCIWRNYGLKAKERGQKLLSDERLSKIALPPEVTEAHYLTEIYRQHAFPALLADALSSELSGRDNVKWLVHFPESAGCLDELAARFEQMGTCKAAWNKWLCPLVSIVALLSLLMKLPKRQTSDIIHSSSSSWIACIFQGKGTHTKHLWSWLLEQRNLTVLVLGHRAADRTMREEAKVAGLSLIYPMSLRDFPSAAFRLLRIWNPLLTLHCEVEKDIGVHCPFHFHTKAAFWFLRGFLHERWILSSILPTDAKIVHGLIAHADSRIADLAFRSRGLGTVHWIHGVVEDALHFRANCSVGLCITPNDRHVRSVHGSYRTCVAPDSPIAPETSVKNAGKGILIVTNLIHPDNRFSRYGGSVYLANLLSAVSEAFHPDVPITWRPHPRESVSADFKRLESLAKNLGMTVDNQVSFIRQIEECRWAVSTLSTSIGDLTRAGVVPAVFTGVPADQTSHARVIPNQIKFHTSQGLQAVIESLKDPTLHQSLLRVLLKEFPPHRLTPNDLESFIS